MRIFNSVPTSIAIFISFIALHSSVTQASAIMSVPNRMLLSAKMEAAQITKALLTALNIDTESPIPTIKQMQSSTADKVIKSHTGKYGSVCFVVRRPG